MMTSLFAQAGSQTEEIRNDSGLRPSVLYDFDQKPVKTRFVPFNPEAANVLEHAKRPDNVWWHEGMGVTPINGMWMSMAPVACRLFAHEGGDRIAASTGGLVVLSHGLRTLWATAASNDALMGPVYLDFDKTRSIAGVLPISPSKRNPLHALRMAVRATISVMDMSFPHRDHHGLPGFGGVSVDEGLTNRIESRGATKAILSGGKRLPDSTMIPIRSRYVEPECRGILRTALSSGAEKPDMIGNVVYYATGQTCGNHSTYVYMEPLSRVWLSAYAAFMAKDGFVDNNEAEDVAFAALRQNPDFDHCVNWRDVENLVQTIQYVPNSRRSTFINAVEFQRLTTNKVDRASHPAPASRDELEEVLHTILHEMILPQRKSSFLLIFLVSSFI